MTFTIAPKDLEDITGYDISQSDITLINSQLTTATSQLQNRVNRTFIDTDSDVLTLKRAVAFLASYYLRIRNKELELAKSDLANYYREVKEFHIDVEPEKRRSFNPKISVLTNDGLDD